MTRSAYQIASPFVSFEEYSRLSGVPINTIRCMVREGRLPIRTKLKPQEKPLINMLALMREADEQCLVA
ncbi:DNA-binding protein [Shewanella sp. VB17]|uniref:DNA-binding protein n=1 Tax=Shewanella sp. VB17 TaxID=2739432 RepID=UPI0015653493|nr:DNA-binding protein [Shewanella sp. VB17]NRD73230.1 DNA-binding protein [Shewanella sp. VB17]